jgi:hypothetical protein
MSASGRPVVGDQPVHARRLAGEAPDDQMRSRKTVPTLMLSSRFFMSFCMPASCSILACSSVLTVMSSSLTDCSSSFAVSSSSLVDCSSSLVDCSSSLVDLSSSLDACCSSIVACRFSWYRPARVRVPRCAPAAPACSGGAGGRVSPPRTRHLLEAHEQQVAGPTRSGSGRTLRLTVAKWPSVPRRSRGRAPAGSLRGHMHASPNAARAAGPRAPSRRR